MKMWAGRFKKEEDKQVNDFNSSIRFDKRLYKEDITGSIAHAGMLGKCGIIDVSESEKIIEGLKGILADIESGKLEISDTAEDIHMFVEEVLTERIGVTGKRLHTSRSRNDQVALDMKMYVKHEIENVRSKVVFLAETVIETAKENTDTVMSGYTHLQRAQPVTLAHQLLAYAQMLQTVTSSVLRTASSLRTNALSVRALCVNDIPHRPLHDCKRTRIFVAHGKQHRFRFRP